MLNFTFSNPTTIHFGRGQIKALSGELKKLNAKKILIVTGQGSVKKNGIFDSVVKEIKKTGASFIELSGIKPNPRLESVYEGIELCRKEKADFILPVGGGSVIDAAKTIAAGVKYDGDAWDFFAKGAQPKSALPIGAVLTLSATGSEMNPNAVITNEKAKRKLSLSSPFIRPVFSILDPEYTFTVNSFHTAAGVADIMAHVFEYYLSPVLHTEVQDALARGLLEVCVNFGKTVCLEPKNYNARANIMWASTLALSGIIGKGTISDWTCHAIEHEISAISDISHGAGLAILLPAFMTMAGEKYGDEKLKRYASAVLKTNDASEGTRKFFNSLGLPSKLREAGITPDDFDKIAGNVVESRGETKEFEQFSKQDVLNVLKLCVNG